ncbi:MAG: (2Fe-2S) ferredoxin domain-containing protein [Deltaproteobacteria bacterium]|nr:(2Fe-2S) ferredoxin domain-containing protein [Deltaproteobacteria bacterium]
MKPYKQHIFVCLGKRCEAKGSEAVIERLKERVKGEGIKGVKLSRSGCLSVCKETEQEAEFCPAVVVYPQGVWYRNVGVKEIDEILDAHVKGGLTDRLVHYKLQ